MNDDILYLFQFANAATHGIEDFSKGNCDVGADYDSQSVDVNQR